MSHFDEKSGVVPCSTPWGSWSQTIDEVFVEIEVTEGTRSKDIKCSIGPTTISIAVGGEQIIKVWRRLSRDAHVIL